LAAETWLGDNAVDLTKANVAMLSELLKSTVLRLGEGRRSISGSVQLIPSHF
jgi:hypothetical protein